MSACPDPSVLEGFGEGRLDPATREAVELHLDGCSSCAQLLAQLAQLFGSAAGDTRVTGFDRPAVRASGGATPLTVGRYQLGRRIGAGGMGMVYEAVDPELHRKVAIKLLHPGVGGDVELTRARMLREARAMAQLAHPNVVAVHDVGRVGEQVFVAMELVEGTTLTRWLHDRRRSLREVLATFVQAGRGLQAAHQVGLVHRDFKPDNVLIGADGRARVTDFGLARPAIDWPEGDHDAAAVAAAAGLGATSQLSTAHGAIVGTPAYMAPEQWRGVPADARSDQYAFCVALYEACFHARPFTAEGLYDLAEQVLRGRVTPPPRSAPAWLRAAILRGLAVDPAARHPAMAELLAALERDRSRVYRLAGVAAAMAVSVAATVGVLALLAEATSPAAPDSSLPTALAPAPVPTVPTVPTPDDTPACAAKADTAEGRWNAQRRAAMVARIGTMEHADAIAGRTLPVLDAWVARYAAEATPLCAATPTPTHVEARRRCLASALARFDALIQHALDLPSFDVDDSLAHAARRLPALQRCASEAWLSVAPAPPTAAQQAEIASLTAELAAAEALLALDRLTPAAEALAQVVTRAQALGYAPLLAEAQLAAGIAHAERHEPDDAVVALEAAAATADGGVDDHAFLRAAVALVEQHGARRLRGGEADRWRTRAAAIVSRVDDPQLRGALALAHGLGLHAHAHYRDAVDALEAAVPDLRAAGGDDDPELARAHVAAGMAWIELAELDRAAAAIETGRAALERSVGPTDLRFAAATIARARVSLAAGDLPAALAAADRAWRVPYGSQSLRHDFDAGLAYGALGDVFVAQGRLDEAAQMFDKAAIYLYVDAPKAWPLQWQGELLVARGDAAAGLSRLAEALAIAEAHYGADDPRLVAMLRANGRAQRRAGELASARASFVRALGIAQASWGYGPGTALVQAELAELEQQAGDDARALELFDDVYVPWVGAFGQHHPRVRANVLVRADLAWTLGRHDYAAGLYRALLDELRAAYGPKDARTARAQARAASAAE